jgi:hypothetical protein
MVKILYAAFQHVAGGLVALLKVVELEHGAFNPRHAGMVNNNVFIGGFEQGHQVVLLDAASRQGRPCGAVMHGFKAGF